MGGAPPLPHDFAPQGVKNVPFLALRGSGARGGPGGPRRRWQRGPPGAPWGARTPRRGLGMPPREPGLESPRPEEEAVRAVRLYPPEAGWGNPPGGSQEERTPLGVDRGGNLLRVMPRAAATNSPTHLEPSATGIAGRGKSRRRRTKMGGRGDPSQEASVSVRTRLGLPAVPAAQGLADPKQTRQGGGGRQNPRGYTLGVPGGTPGGRRGRGGPRGDPRGPPGPGGCTFSRVFNNSPSRDRMGHPDFSGFLARDGVYPPRTPPRGAPPVPPRPPLSHK